MPSDDPQAALGRVRLYAERLLESLAELESIGGLNQAGRATSPKAAARVADLLRLVHAESAEVLDHYRPPKPPRRPDPRQPPTPSV